MVNFEEKFEVNIYDIYDGYNEFGRTLGMTYEVKGPGVVDHKLTVTEDLLATRTAMHGGALAGFMDAVTGIAAMSAVVPEEKVVSTIEFKLSFLKPIFLGDELRGEGRVINKGNRILTVEGKVFNQNGDLVGCALGTFNAYPFVKSDMIP